jgi:hypothetical protein
VEAHSVRMEIVLILRQDRCMVCAERTTRLRKLFWTDSMELLVDVGHVESHFFPFGDCVSVIAR